MKRLVIALTLVVSLTSLLSAQDGIYGSFLVGMKTMDMGALNDALKSSHNVKFENSNLTFGGEGHVLLAKHICL